MKKWNRKQVRICLFFATGWLVFVDLLKVIFTNIPISNESLFRPLKNVMTPLFDIQFSYFLIVIGLCILCFVLLEKSENKPLLPISQKNPVLPALFILFALFSIYTMDYYTKYILDLIEYARYIYQNNPDQTDQVKNLMTTEILNTMSKLLFILSLLFWGVFQITKRASLRSLSLFGSLFASAVFFMFRIIGLITYYNNTQVNNKNRELLLSKNLLANPVRLQQYNIPHLILSLIILITLAISCGIILMYGCRKRDCL